MPGDTAADTTIDCATASRGSRALRGWASWHWRKAKLFRQSGDFQHRDRRLALRQHVVPPQKIDGANVHALARSDDLPLSMESNKAP